MYGSVDLPSGTQFSAMATYMCQNGYRLEGSSSSECLATGDWSLEQPTCIIYGLLNICKTLKLES